MTRTVVAGVAVVLLVLAGWTILRPGDGAHRSGSAPSPESLAEGGPDQARARSAPVRSEPFAGAEDWWALRLTDEATAAPVIGGQVFTVADRSGPVTRDALAASSGRDGVAALPSNGAYVVIAKGYCPKWCDVGATGITDTRLQKPGSLFGTITDITGAPVSGLKVTFSVESKRSPATLSDDAAVILPDASEAGIAAAAITDETGAFRVDGLPDGATVFCHLDTIDYRVRGYGANEPIVVRRPHARLDIRVFPVYLGVVALKGWLRGGDTWLRFAQRPVPPGLRSPADSDMNPSARDSQEGWWGTCEEVYLRAAREARLDESVPLRRILYFGEGVERVDPVVTAHGWSLNEFDVRIPLGDIALCLPSHLGRQHVKIVDAGRYQTHLDPDHRRVKLRFLGADGMTPESVAIPCTVRKRDVNGRIVLRRSSTPTNGGVVEALLPVGQYVVQPSFGAASWPVTSLEAFAPKRIEVAQDGDQFDLVLDDEVRLVRLTVRDHRSGKLLPSFWCDFSHELRGFFQLDPVFRRGELVFVSPRASLPITVSMTSGWNGRRTKKLTLTPKWGLNEVIVDL
ncbi:MAG: hypothetical protein CMJ83_16840 [Planctomycetes bacterium]|nr:hypothetical protein [Planctomycetota bacterium]